MKTIKIICQWDSPLKAQEVFNRMSKDGKGSWNNIKFVENEKDIPDYYILINYPGHISNEEYYINLLSNPKKILFFHLEPSYFYNKLGFFANPPKNLFGGLYTHNYERNIFQWTLNQSYTDLINSDFSKFKNNNSINHYSKNNYNKMSALISSLYIWPGHKLRADFIHYLEDKHPEFKFDLYGKSNEQQYKTYLGSIPVYKKDDGVIPYKYTFNAENSNETNYATEKIVDSILAECLCFYWGCPNLEDYLDPNCFIRLPLEDFEKSYQIIKSSIENNEWEKRLPIIKQMKLKILNELQFFPHIEKLILNLK